LMAEMQASEGDQGTIAKAAENAFDAGAIIIAANGNFGSDPANVTQIKPYLCPTDGTGLPENSCDLAFFSMVYHHLKPDGRVDYLRHLCKVVKPSGRVCVIERYAELIGRHTSHAVSLSQLAKQAELAGWIPVRYELISGTRHYIALLVQKDLFSSK